MVREIERRNSVDSMASPVKTWSRDVSQSTKQAAPRRGRPPVILDSDDEDDDDPADLPPHKAQPKPRSRDSTGSSSSSSSDSSTKPQPTTKAAPVPAPTPQPGSSRSAMIDLTNSPPSTKKDPSKPPIARPLPTTKPLPPKPKDYDSIFTGRQVKMLSLDELNAGPSKPFASRPHVAPPSSPHHSRAPAPIMAPKNPPPSPIKTAAMAWGEERYGKQRPMATGDVEKHLKDMVKSQVNMENVDTTLEMPSELTKTLLPHQVQGIQWLKSREDSKKSGGILADDMGLGKTVQSIGLMLLNRPVFGDPRCTLVVVPLALKKQWAEEIKSFTKLGALRVYEHHGPKRTTDPAKLERHDVVVTTYDVVGSEYPSSGSSSKKAAASDSDSDDNTAKKINKSAASKEKPAGALFKARFHRIILDEAHTIKNPKSIKARACTDLNAKRRWCLTGTPIQNSEQDLYSLFKFLGRIASPYDQQSVFKAKVSDPVKRGRGVGALNLILPIMMLRRTKLDQNPDGSALLKLPARHVEVLKCSWADEAEQEFYDALKNRVEITFNKFAKKGIMQSYIKVLTLLLRLRQACLHPHLVSKGGGSDALELASNTKGSKEEPDEDMDALADLFSGVKVQSSCMICQARIEKGKMCKDCEAQEQQFATLASSTKIRKVMTLLNQIQKEGRKTIIFCNFTSMFEILEPFLKKAGLGYVKYIGSMPNDKREEALSKIKNDPKCTVILISLKCGSVGLNLTACSRVIMLDLWWNPAIEDQAIDRAHRLGQREDVKVYKITIQDTIEDRLLELQEKKKVLAKAALANDQEAKDKLNKLSERDLMYLFNGE